MDIFSNFKFKSYQRGNISNQEPLTATFHLKISNFSTIFNNFYTLCYSFLHIFALNLKNTNMKKLLSLIALLTFVACGSSSETDTPTPPPAQDVELICKILSPESGYKHDMTQPLEIRVDGSISVGNLDKAYLKINNKVVESFKEFPYTYTHNFNLQTDAEGTVEISVTAEAAGVSKSDKVTITTFIPHDGPQVLSCEITAPTDGQEVNPEEELVIRGEGGADWGEITDVELKVGDLVIEQVKRLPFKYNHTFGEDVADGELPITLTITGEEENIESHTVTIIIKRPEPKPEGVTYVVAKDGSGDYYTVGEAIAAASTNSSKRQVIYIKPGTYYEKITIPSNKPFITLVGDSAESTIITYDDYAGKKLEDGSEMGTQNSASFTIKATDFMAVNITFQNTFQNNSSSGAQAVAVCTQNDRAVFYNCRLLGYQDTFYVKNNGRVYCKDCYIEGNVDFIFGDATLLCEDCHLHCNRNNSVVTAAADHSNNLFGFNFIDCRITHIEGTDFTGSQFKTLYLGRPWKQNARVVFIRCEEPALLNAAAWCRMSDGVDAALFAEYKCTGEGAAAERLEKREMGGRQLSDSEAAEYTLKNIFSSKNNPSKYNSDWTPDIKFSL